jgi:Stress responsive A/B Barrel Domain
MIKHEVILRIRPDVRREIIDRMLGEVYHLLKDIPGVEQVRYGTNNAPAYRHALIVVDLKDEDALNGMGRHPYHTKAVRLVNRLAESTAVGSYLATERQG